MYFLSLTPLWLLIGIFLTRSISKMWSYLGVEVMICWATCIDYTDQKEESIFLKMRPHKELEKFYQPSPDLDSNH